MVLYWSYFKTRFERLLRAGMRNLPPRVTEDLLGRYATIAHEWIGFTVSCSTRLSGPTEKLSALSVSGSNSTRCKSVGTRSPTASRRQLTTP